MYKNWWVRQPAITVGVKETKKKKKTKKKTTNKDLTGKFQPAKAPSKAFMNLNPTPTSNSKRRGTVLLAGGKSPLTPQKSMAYTSKKSESFTAS